VTKPVQAVRDVLGLTEQPYLLVILCGHHSVARTAVCDGDHSRQHRGWMQCEPVVRYGRT
jgi:hypothetical protein